MLFVTRSQTSPARLACSPPQPGPDRRRRPGGDESVAQRRPVRPRRRAGHQRRGPDRRWHGPVQRAAFQYKLYGKHERQPIDDFDHPGVLRTHAKGGGIATDYRLRHRDGHRGEDERLFVDPTANRARRCSRSPTSSASRPVIVEDNDVTNATLPTSRPTTTTATTSGLSPSSTCARPSLTRSSAAARRSGTRRATRAKCPT